MDEAKVRVQVISRVQVPIDLKHCQETNKVLCEAVKRHNLRLAGVRYASCGRPSQHISRLGALCYNIRLGRRTHP